MTGISNSEIKLIRSLKAKKARDAENLFVVEGEKLVAEALASDFEVVKTFRREEIGEETMSRITLLDSPSPVLALVRKKEWKIPETAKGLCLALDSVRDPGNLGTILRISDWFGIDAVFASRDTVDVYNPKTVQSTMGALFRKPLIYCDIPELCRSFASKGGKVYGTFLHGEDIYTSPLDESGLIVMGNEANGISPEVARSVTDRLTIPSFGACGAESLNVAVATAVTVAEFRRRAHINGISK